MLHLNAADMLSHSDGLQIGPTTEWLSTSAV